MNPSLYGGNGSGLLPGPFCPSDFRFTEKFPASLAPTSDDRDFYQACGIKLVSPVPEWQVWVNRWAQAAANGERGYGRFSWRICGFAPASPSPSASPGVGPGGIVAPASIAPNPLASPPLITPVPRPGPTKKP